MAFMLYKLLTYLLTYIEFQTHLDDDAVIAEWQLLTRYCALCSRINSLIMTYPAGTVQLISEVPTREFYTLEFTEQCWFSRRRPCD